MGFWWYTFRSFDLLEVMQIMNINIKNCNNIDEGNISITENKLNIKYGINGTGKSTIAKAIQYSLDESKNLSDLTPFKLLENNTEELKPEIAGLSNIKSFLIFNEDYVKQFVFKQEELVENSFDIFIKTAKYQKKVEEIESSVLDITSVFKNNQNLNLAIDEFKKLSDNFKITKDGMSKASKGYKSLVDGNKIKNIPKGLESYEVFLKSDKNIEWLDWHNQGENFLEISNNCPYCVSSIADKKDQIKKIIIEYDKNLIKNLELIIKTIEKLGDYFSGDTISALKKITTQKDGLEKDEMDFLVSVKKQVDNLIDKFEKLKYLSHADFRDVEKVEDVIKPLLIDINLYDRLDSDKTKEIVTSINVSLDNVLKKINDLQKEVGEQKSEVRQLIIKHKKGIDEFLKKAGYKYEVIIENIGYKLKLKHFDSSGLLTGGQQHLSFGEKNAFALVLFMYEVLSKNPDLIILDDPISSFDKNKKYAILDMLFRQKECLKNKNVLMLTHDIEPVIDTTKALTQFKDLSVSSFLSLKDGILTEQDIKKSDILTFPQICEEVIVSKGVDEIIKLIYLRRCCEIMDDKGIVYEILSDLFHKRSVQEATDLRVSMGIDPISDSDFKDGIEKIGEKIHDNFDYDKMLEKFKDIQMIKTIYNLTKNSYEKLQLFRIIDAGYTSDVMKKFINESYHIENEFINQLNPIKFDLVPEFIIKECDEAISAIE